MSFKTTPSKPTHADDAKDRLNSVTLNPYTMEVAVSDGASVWLRTYREALESEAIAARLLPITKMLMRMNVEGTKRGAQNKTEPFKTFILELA
jgi:hypothetical protein